ncbi:hypothetical protein FDUTEX481_00458 [Tolypothrix sp. PCC 7601]|nr:hypothetical protein FDUTEX481_00458 [Tolypothrix sp. PCC 7601]
MLTRKLQQSLTNSALGVIDYTISKYQTNIDSTIVPNTQSPIPNP